MKTPPLSVQHSAQDAIEAGRRRLSRRAASAVVLIAGTAILLAFVFSALRGFTFFIDSITYLNRIVYVPIITELSYLYPAPQAAVAATNAYLLLRLIRLSISSTSLFLISPYVLLLLTNYTKESLLFLGAIVFYIPELFAHRRLTRILARAGGLAMFVVRPIYIAQTFPAGLTALTLLAAVVLVLASPSELADLISTLGLAERIDRQAATEHVGRSFFNYLCTKEKRDVSLFVPCVTRVLVFIPDHEDLLSPPALLYVIFQANFWVVFIRLIKVRRLDARKIAFMLVLLYYAIFALAPTFGAFVRYYYPAIWLASAYLIRRDLQNTGRL